MNKILCALFCVLFYGTANAVPAVVDYVLDGDTFAAAVKLEDDISITVRVRLINVDTPEMSGECAREIDLANQAKEYVTDLLPTGSVVDLQNIKDDKYLGRIDANVILPDGRDLGDVLVDKKLARKYNGGRRAGWCK
jgi:endonuclease YncB( thermonuclease family)